MNETFTIDKNCDYSQPLQHFISYFVIAYNIVHSETPNRIEVYIKHQILHLWSKFYLIIYEIIGENDTDNIVCMSSHKTV